MIPLRDENPVRITPYLTYLLIAINVIVYLLEVTGGVFETRQGLAGTLAGYTMVPYEITHGVDVGTNGVTARPFWLTILTSTFMHGGWLHLGGNMLYLWIFGNNIEEALGRVRYLLFYLVCGVCAALAQIVMGPNSIVPNLGASGAIAGVLGAYLVLYPTARVDSLLFLGIFFTKIRIPAFVLLGFWIVSQFFSQILGSMTMPDHDTGGVAYMAHIGGFIAGCILIRLFGGKAIPQRPLYGPYGNFDDGYGSDERRRR